MGIHYVQRPRLLPTGLIDATQPEGPHLRTGQTVSCTLLGVEYIVDAEDLAEK